MLPRQPNFISLGSRKLSWRMDLCLLQLHCHTIVPRADLPIRARKEKAANKRKEENRGKNRVCLERENPRSE